MMPKLDPSVVIAVKLCWLNLMIMDSPNSSSLQQSSTTDVYSNRNKRKASEDEYFCSCNLTVGDLLKELDMGRYGNVTAILSDLLEHRMDSLEPFYKLLPESTCSGRSIDDSKDASTQSKILGEKSVKLKNGAKRGKAAHQTITIDSDEEDIGDQASVQHRQNVLFNIKSSSSVQKALADGDATHIKKYNDMHAHMDGDFTKENKKPSLAAETSIEKDKGTYIGVEDSFTDEEDQQLYKNDDDLGDIWQEMTFAMESCKDTSVNSVPAENVADDEEGCEHSVIFNDEIGYVCRICGVVQKGIESIIEYQYAKKTSTRTYKYEDRSARDGDGNDILPGVVRSTGHDFVETEIFVHPRHSKIMKPHQLEGFKFLARNLLNDNPGGCILAHAPGSGKTFMIISFIQTLMAKYPSARPLVVLPKGILRTWKKEFLLWQIEDIPLLDFYSVNANSRSQQLEVLKQWVEKRSILFLGYVQFSSLVSNPDTDEATAACQKILLELPSLLIMDEGHTPRNENTDQLAALKSVQTPRKVVLSGTLYQNHVEEVFNILNLVRPRFLRLEACKGPKRHILSIIETTKKGNLQKKSDHEFYEMVEESLLKDGDLNRKALIIQCLREMTSKVLHYYKGDSLDELPGLVDFTVFLNLSPRQKHEVQELKKLGGRFKISSDGGSIYVHPQLKCLLKSTARKSRVDQVNIDKILNKLDINEGVKAKFYLDLLHLCESNGEKLIVFSQYLPPIKFLERLTVKVKGWTPGKEIFMITGDLENDARELNMELFNNSSDSRVFFGSIKACSEGISLVGASRIIILDIHLNPSVTRQAIGRAFRPGQVKKVYTYRLVATGTLEQEDHSTSFKKESIPKLWFEWNEACRAEDFQLEKVDVTDCGDAFLETPRLHEDVVSLYRR
ncbi:SNF2 domain-containing protein / helicase domain-containing protein [Heracleum sosnowskyi]|uniref:SNF2 domain-containing protein / helicase domain-containing protein n=1 Tax=Heracleum sosnowskyi TaxID=360622 RepID=A0AAD8NB81_9APIA|nr:SNF2 domain-containing protein / helicase domain-containing protein [Heracleum sosnowskyi]